MLQSSVGLYDRIVGSECFELILSRHEGEPCEFGDMTGHYDVVALRGIEPSSDGRATEG